MRKPWLVFALRGTIAVAAADTLRIVYGLAIEPYRLEVKTVKLRSSKLAHATGPLRIAHISDLHCDASPRLEDSLPAVIGEQRPDLIVFTGDAGEHAYEVDYFDALCDASLPPVIRLLLNVICAWSAQDSASIIFAP